MVFDIDTTSSNPIYAQIVAQIKRGIAAGALRAGDALPSLREMATRLRINPLTVARGYRELERSGVVVTQHGRGTFISDRTSELAEQYRGEALAEAVDRLLIEAQHLGASAGEVRATVEERVQAFHGSPSQAETATSSADERRRGR